MDKYSRIYNRSFESLQGILKPIICKSCAADGLDAGECKKCLENRAWNREYLETHTFITYKGLGCYHDTDHDLVKTIFLRNEDEHPYLYYGPEVEIEFGYEDVRVPRDEDYYDDETGDYDYIDEILDGFTEITDGLFVYEKDSSLDNGVEFIGRPASYAFWTKPETVEKIKAGFEYLKEHGALINQPNGNGMHVHISKKFFENRAGRERNAKYADLDWIFQIFQNELEKIGGRKYGTYCNSKKNLLEEKLKHEIRCQAGDASIEDLKVTGKMKKGTGCLETSHAYAVIQDSATVEARIFKSTVDYEQFYANIEVVRALAHAVCEDKTDATLNDILHTKDTMFLDKILKRVELNCKKNEEEFNLDRKFTDEIKIEA